MRSIWTWHCFLRWHWMLTPSRHDLMIQHSKWTLDLIDSWEEGWGGGVLRGDMHGQRVWGRQWAGCQWISAYICHTGQSSFTVFVLACPGFSITWLWSEVYRSTQNGNTPSCHHFYSFMTFANQDVRVVPTCSLRVMRKRNAEMEREPLRGGTKSPLKPTL